MDLGRKAKQDGVWLTHPANKDQKLKRAPNVCLQLEYRPHRNKGRAAFTHLPHLRLCTQSENSQGLSSLQEDRQVPSVTGCHQCIQHRLLYAARSPAGSGGVAPSYWDTTEPRTSLPQSHCTCTQAIMQPRSNSLSQCGLCATSPTRAANRT
jgi:hypothetical protein